MAKSASLVVNGFKVPGGCSRLAVMAGVDLLLARGSVPRGEFLETAAVRGGLNQTNAGWLVTDPASGSTMAPRSPVGKLWTRVKKDVIHIQLLPGAHVLGGLYTGEKAAQAAKYLATNMARSMVHLDKTGIDVGTVVTACGRIGVVTSLNVRNTTLEIRTPDGGSFTGCIWFTNPV